MHIYVHSDQGLHHSIFRFIKVQRVSKKNAKTDQTACMPRLFIISAHFAHATRSLFSCHGSDIWFYWEIRKKYPRIIIKYSPYKSRALMILQMNTVCLIKHYLGCGQTTYIFSTFFFKVHVRCKGARRVVGACHIFYSDIGYQGWPTLTSGTFGYM